MKAAASPCFLGRQRPTVSLAEPEVMQEVANWAKTRKP